MHFNPDIVSNLLSFKSQTNSSTDSAVLANWLCTSSPCLLSPHRTITGNAYNFAFQITKHAHFINIQTTSRLGWGWGWRVVSRRRQTGREKEQRDEHGLLPAWTWPGSLSQQSQQSSARFKGYERQVLTGFPNNTPHLKAPTKDLQGSLTELHNAEPRPGVFVVFVSIQWSSNASPEVTVGGNAIFHYTKYK